MLVTEYVGLVKSAVFEKSYLGVLIRKGSESVGTRCFGQNTDGFMSSNVVSNDNLDSFTSEGGLCGFTSPEDGGVWLIESGDLTRVRVVAPGKEQGLDMTLKLL